jgi:hypothetical protein
MMAVLAALALASGCGGGESAKDPLEQVPQAGGLRDKVHTAQEVRVGDFPAVRGRSLQQLADQEATAGPEAGLASSDFTVGQDRLSFGVIDQQGQFIYGKTAVYLAPSPGARARGPFPAPADLLVTAPPYRSRQAASETDPFAAVYAAQVTFPKPGRWSVLVLTEQDGAWRAAPTQVQVSRKADDPIPAVGDPAPRVKTDTVASAKGDVSKIDTRVPPSDMHARSFDEVVGSKPVALLFATPQLCQSRVCGPVTDIALQMKARYGSRMEFIHQEVYAGNDPSKGLREPLRRFNLRTEPWLFVVDKSGRITARLEGSFGLKAFERAVRTAL